MSEKKRISIVVGTRPEAIKMAPVIRALKKEAVVLSVCKTGQHADMVDSVLQNFDISPDVDFAIMGKVKNLNDSMALMLSRFQEYYLEFKPDIVLVQGDTASVCAAAIAAFNLQIKVAHIEAGLRTGNLQSPWPEEGFRSIISPIVEYHFAPTKQSYDNLIREGVSEEKIHLTGNTVIDALVHMSDMINSGTVEPKLPSVIEKSKNQKSVLITGHRRENLDSGLLNMCSALSRLAERHSDYDFIFPVHLNPDVQLKVKDFFRDKKHPNLFFIDPQAYPEFVYLMKNCHFIITDSGGIQEEAPSLGKPVLVTRDTTERPEGLDAGTLLLVGKEEDSLYEAAEKLFDDEAFYTSMAQANNPYGDGRATERILSVIL